MSNAIGWLDDANTAIDKTIMEMCKKLQRATPGSEEFCALADAISKLRASLNPIVMNPEK